MRTHAFILAVYVLILSMVAALGAYALGNVIARIVQALGGP